MAIYSGFSNKKIVIFHSYVKLPEGNDDTGSKKWIKTRQIDLSF